MKPVIDLCLDLPPDEQYMSNTLQSYLLDPACTNFKSIYAPTLLKILKTDLDEADRILSEQGEVALIDFIRNAARKNTPTLAQFVQHMDEIGVQWGITNDPSHDNARTAEIIRQFPDRFKGFIFLNQSTGMPAVRELEMWVKEYGLHALYITPFRVGLPASDKKLYPLYAKACELDIPVHFHCSMSSATNVPYDIGHPRYIDEVACDFPELRIMAAVGGFPWVYEFLTLPIRHSNLYVNIETHAPGDLAIPGSGMEGYLFYGEKIIQDRVCFASNWSALGLSLEDMIAQVDTLPFSDRTKKMMLYDNAARFWREL